VTPRFDLDRAAGSELGAAHVAGHPSRRLMVILRAPGCAYARATGGCTNCGFHHLTTGGEPVPAARLVTQLRGALAAHANELHTVEQLDLYCSGSFFCPSEIPADAQEELLAVAAAVPSVRVVLVESRPEYVTADALAKASAALARGVGSARREVALEVAIGLESRDDEIREQRIRKGFSILDFEHAVEKLVAAGAHLVVYLLLKPLGTQDGEALADVDRSGLYLHTLREFFRLYRETELHVRVALEPVFVAEGTPLHDELRAGRYRPPSLWTAVHAARMLGERLPVHVGLSSEGLPAETVPRGCDSCTPALRRALARFNETQDRQALEGLSCEACGRSTSG